MLNDFYAALRTVIAEVWPDVATAQNGIWEADHIENIPWDKLTPPYAVIAIHTLPKATGYGAVNQVYSPDVEIYRVEAVKGPLSGIRDNLEALDDTLMQTALTVGQVVAVQNLTWSLELEPNQVFAQKRMTHRAGRLTVSCLVGRILGNGPSSE